MRSAVCVSRKPQEDLQAIIDDIFLELTDAPRRRKVADYIPQLARVDAATSGMAIVTTGGKVYRAGDAEMPFSIQSISKVFTLTLALGKHGRKHLERVGATFGLGLQFDRAARA